MASKCTGGIKRKSFSALSSSSMEEVTLNWRIQKFKEVVEVAGTLNKATLGRLNFFMDGAEADEIDGSRARVPLVWSLELCTKDDGLDSTLNEDKQSVAIRLHFGSEPVERIHSSRDFVCRFDVETRVGITNTLKRIEKAKGLWNLRTDFCYSEIFDLDKVGEHLDVEGSLTLILKTTAYQELAQGFAGKEDVDAMQQTLDVKCLRGVLSAVSSLFGDEKTSDVKICVVDEENELGKFFCHKAILCGRSRVFRAMFDMNTVEKREGVVNMSDVSVEVVDQFLTFLYSGQLKDYTIRGSSEPLWVKMLGSLVYIADKYDVSDLKEFCDANFHRAVTNENAMEMFQLAKRHQLLGAQEKLRNHLRKNLDVFLEYI